MSLPDAFRQTESRLSKNLLTLGQAGRSVRQVGVPDLDPGKQAPIRISRRRWQTAMRSSTKGLGCL